MVNLLIASDRYRLLLKYSLIVFLKKCSIFSWFVHSLQVFHLRAWPLCASVIIYYIYIYVNSIKFKLPADRHFHFCFVLSAAILLNR